MMCGGRWLRRSFQLPDLLMILCLILYASSSVILLFNLSSAALLPRMRKEEVQGLLVIKEGLNVDTSGALRTWNDDGQAAACSWTGIECDDGGHVSALRLDRLSLSGHLEDSSLIRSGLEKLRFLHTLSLSHNNLSGPIHFLPLLLQHLPLLRRLDLSFNALSGPLPPASLFISSLHYLDISHNSLSGSIPPEVFDHSCAASAAAPCSPISYSPLHYLSLAGNSLHGLLPLASISRSCPDLRHLNLSANLLDSTDIIDTSTTATTSTTSATVLPAEDEEGESQKQLLVLPHLTVLDLSDNSLSGPLPPLGSQKLMPSLVTTSLRNNRFSGPIPPQLGAAAASSLTYLDLGHNLISGALPESLRTLASLAYLDLSHNSIGGSLPPWLATSFPALTSLHLASNRLSGPLPSSLGLLKELAALDLSHNMLHGDIPGSLSRCDALRSLDLSSNRLNGTLLMPVLPPGLLLLNLSHNALTSPGLTYTQCGLLRVLDLSHNRLSGNLPGLLPCEMMEYFNVSHNSFGGRIPGIFPTPTLSDGSGGNLAAIDLSHNELCGEIPRSIGRATSLSTLLLDHNRLNGSIPHEIGNCSSLTNINLAHNKLSGSIPAEMGSLRELASLDLSFNELEGPVPEYGALLRFDAASFVGNTRLCGANVNATCPTTAAKPLVLDPNSTLIVGGGSLVRPSPSSSARSSLSSATVHKEQQHSGIMLSISAILAIAAAAAISAGVVVILLLNSYSSMRSRKRHIGGDAALSDGVKSMRRSMSSSARSLAGAGKLVMFSKRQTSSDGVSVESGGGDVDEEEHDDLIRSSEEWVSSAHALLSKDSELAAANGGGGIYKAVLGDGRTVVIKKLTISSAVKPQHEFERDMEPLGRIKHKNVVALRGYYWTPELQLLIYDFVRNGSLYKRLHEAEVDPRELLPWPARFKIACGIARGLAHLHHQCEPSVVHSNVKSANVLLDDCCNPKLADTGLLGHLLQLDHHRHRNHREYCIAPELLTSETCHYNKPPIDVYGFGMIVLELVTGRRPVEFVGDDPIALRDYVRSSLDASMPMLCVDPKLPPDQYTEAEMLPIIKLGLVCCSRDPQSRPTMAEVVHILELIRA